MIVTPAAMACHPFSCVRPAQEVRYMPVQVLHFILVLFHYYYSSLSVGAFSKKIQTIPQLLNVQVRLLLREAITPPGLYRELFPVLWYRSIRLEVVRLRVKVARPSCR